MKQDFTNTSGKATQSEERLVKGVMGLPLTQLAAGEMAPARARTDFAGKRQAGTY